MRPYHIGNGTIADPNNELLASLLAALYPREIPPSEIWRYLTTKGNPDLFGAYFAFWEFRLLEQSSDRDITELLDRLNELMPALRDSFRMYHLDDVPVKLLARALNKLGDEQEPVRLYNWLNAAAYPSWDPPGLADGSIGEIRTWLEQRPDLQKAVLLEGLTRCPDGGGFDIRASEVLDLLHGSALPDDLGLWCLETAVAWADIQRSAADHLLRHAVHLCGQKAGGLGLTHSVLRECTLGHEALERRLESWPETDRIMARGYTPGNQG